MTSLAARETAIDGLIEITRARREDERGYLSRLFCAEELAPAGWAYGVAQVNMTLTKFAGTVRGMHFQSPPHAEAKLVSCLEGEVFDVAVDIRAGSPTFLKWQGFILSGSNRKSLLIPPGFAHGFQTLTANCMMHYVHSCAYAPQSEGAINARDPSIGIKWPLPAERLSTRDAAHDFITPEFAGLSL